MSQFGSSPNIVGATVTVKFVPDTTAMDDYRQSVDRWLEDLRTRFAAAMDIRESLQSHLTMLDQMLVKVREIKSEMPEVKQPSSEHAEQRPPAVVDQQLVKLTEVVTALNGIGDVVDQISVQIQSMSNK